MFSVVHDAFNGAMVTLLAEPSEVDIAELVKQQKLAGKQLIWIDLALEQAHLVSCLQKNGFVFHNCEEHRLTMIHRIKPDAYAPFAPTHTLGVGGIVERQNGDVLLVRDKWMSGKGYKIPGGYVDLGEPLHVAAEREVLEETGIQASFDGLVSLVSKHPHQYNKSNQYIICRLTPQSEQINIQDSDEIEDAVWLNPEQFIADEDSSPFHRHMIQTLRNKPVMPLDEFDFAGDLSKQMYSAE